MSVKFLSKLTATDNKKYLALMKVGDGVATLPMYKNIGGIEIKLAETRKLRYSKWLALELDVFASSLKVKLQIINA